MGEGVNELETNKLQQSRLEFDINIEILTNVNIPI